VGYGYYPGYYLDLGLATFLLRQRQDFSTVEPPSGWAPGAWYGAGYGEDYEEQVVRRAPRDYGRMPGPGDFGSDRDRESTRYAPRGSTRTKETVVDGVPTLVSDN
jgi:hypothetical protein